MSTRQRTSIVVNFGFALASARRTVTRAALPVIVLAVIAATMTIGAVPNASAAAPSQQRTGTRLDVGQTLRVGSQLTSPSGVYSAAVMTGGRLEVIKRGRAVWTNTRGSGIGNFVKLHANGSLTLRPSHLERGKSTTASGVSYLAVTNSGELNLVSKGGAPIWQGGPVAHVTSTSTAPYTRGALFGSTNPSVTCYTCQAADITGTAPPSNTLDSGTSVDNLTGDFSTVNPLFDAPAIGGDLALSLNYDAQLAQTELTSGSGVTAGPFGVGWSSDFGASINQQSGSSPTSTITVNQGNGSQVSFNESIDYGTSTSCQPVSPTTATGDYPATTKYTVSGSSHQWCALASVQGQLSDNAGTSVTYQSNGGQNIQDFFWNGQLSNVTTTAASSGSSPAGLTVLNGVAGGSTTRTASGTALLEQCPSGVTCNIIYSSDARDIVEELNSSGLVATILDPSGATYTLAYDTSHNLTSVATPNGTSSPSTWHYLYSTTVASPYSSNLIEIEDPDYNASTSTVAHTNTVAYYSSSTGTPGMVQSLVDGTGATTGYAYTASCATFQCGATGASQQTTVTYPAEPLCPTSTTGCSTGPPIEIDQYSAGLETSTELGAGSANALENETWSYAWNYGNGTANTSEVITYPNTLNLAKSSNFVAPTATIITDPYGNITSTTNALGDVATSAYSETPSNNLTELLWSFPGPSSNSASSPPAGASVYTYNTLGQVLTGTDPLGNVTTYGYYGNNSQLCYEAPPSVSAGLSSIPSCTSTLTTNNVGSVGAPVGTTTYSYDAYGDVAARTVDFGDSGAVSDVQTTTAGYDVMGNLSYSIPPTGQTGAQNSSNAFATSSTYITGTSWPATVTQPGGVSNTNVYDAAGNVVSTGNTNDSSMWQFTTTLYDGDNRACYQLKGYGQYASSCTAGNQAGSTRWTYVPGSTAVATSTDSNNDTTSYYYGDLAYPNSPTEVVDPYQTTIQYSAFDDYGNACLTGDTPPIDAAPATVTSSQCNALAGDTSKTYNALGSTTLVTDPAGLNTATNVYANASYPTLVTSTTNELGKITSYLYDADGNLLTTTHPDGTAITNAYNQNGELCSTAPTALQYLCGQGPNVAGVTQYGYNNAQERTSMSDNVDSPATPTIWSQATSYTYALGQLTSTTDSNGKTVGYAYNHAGQVKCVAYPVSTTSTCSSPSSTTNTTVTRTYDSEARLSSVTDWLGNTTNYGYNEYWVPYSTNGITFPSATGVSASYGYSNSGNVSSLSASSTVTSGTAISDSWSQNADEQVAVSSINGATSAWQTYNQNGQVSNAANLATSTSNDNFTMALNGDITKDAAPSGATTNFAYSGNQMCVSAPTATTSCATPATGKTYSYNLNGQRTGATPYTSGTQGSTTNYNWNAYGQLCSTGTSSTPTTTSCGTAPANGTSYQYNGDGLRTTATTNSTAAANISAVGSLQQGNGNGLSTLSVSPVNAGDAFVLAVKVPSATVTVSSVSGGGATWQKLTNAGSSPDVEMWLGTISTTGSSTITLTYSGSVSSSGIELDAQEYTNGTGSSTTWNQDLVGSSNNTTSSTTVAFPSLTPSASNELYVGFARIGNTGLAGSTSGFTYDVTSPNANVYIYDPSVSSVVSPTAAQTPAATSIAVGALIAASGSTTAPTTTASTWDIVSGGSTPLNINDASTTSGTTTNTSYIYGNLLFGGTAPIEQITTTSTGTSVSYLVSNQTGVQGVYSGNSGSLGAVQEMAIYSVYGNQTLSSGTKVTPFGFQGSYTDSTGLIYLVNRNYDPTTDQFISIDPAVVLTNQPYVFVNDNPLNAEDPLGNCGGLFHIVCSAADSVGRGLSAVRTAVDRAACGQPTCTPNVSFGGGLAPGSSAADARAALNDIGIKVPRGYIARPADGGNGWVFQARGAKGDASQIRAMDSSANQGKYSYGYARQTNSDGKYVNMNGEPLGNAGVGQPETHFAFKPTIGLGGGEGGGEDFPPEL